MRNKTGRTTGMMLFCVAFLVAGAAVEAQQSPSPVRMDEDRMAGLDLTAIPPDAYQDILVDGALNMRVATLYSGPQLRVSIFECTPARTDHRTRPTDVDEFVYVLSGKLILTEPNGTAHEFLPGDALVLPIGYTGTWEMQGNYRELVVLNQERGAAPDASPAPVRLNPDSMAGLGLAPIPNDGFIDILVEGELEFEIASLFSGEELEIVVVESTPATTSHAERPLEYDEFVLVLNGKLVLTEPNGTVQEFTPGNAVIVPMGYTGTWEQQGDYRELAIIAAGAMD